MKHIKERVENERFFFIERKEKHMKEIKTENYTVRPSDSPKWVVIESPEGLAVDTELHIMDYHYDCIPKLVPYKNSENKIPCSYFCCYCGAYADMNEINRVNDMMEGVKPLLQPDELAILEKFEDQIYCPEDNDPDEHLFKLRASPKEWPRSESAESTKESNANEEEQEKDQSRPANHCMFLMEDGLCSIHRYCNDTNRNWVKEKFNICTTFPLDIRPQDKTLAFMKDFDSFTLTPVDCICDDEEKKIALGMPQIIESMKYAIVDRYGEEWWAALNAFAQDYRDGKIDLKYLYPSEKGKKGKRKEE